MTLYKLVLLSTLLLVTSGKVSALSVDQQYVDSLNRVVKNQLRSTPEKALKVAMDALQKAEIIGYEVGYADALVYIGHIDVHKEAFSAAQTKYFKALEIYERYNDQARLADCKLAIGGVFFRTKQFEQSLNYNREIIPYFLANNDSTKLAIIHMNMGSSYTNLGNTERTYIEYMRAYDYVDQKNHFIVADLLNNISSVLYDLGKLDSAYNVALQAIDLYESINEAAGLGDMYFTLGLISEEQGNTNIAIEFYHKSLSIADSLDYKDLSMSNLQGLMLCYGTLGNVDSLYHYHSLYSLVQQELMEIIQKEDINELKIEYDTEKKDALLKLEKEQNKAKRKTILILIISIVAIAILTIGIIIYFREKQRYAKLELRQKNEEIMRIMKEQEVLSYESQLEGESQERKRVARELHDRVGGLLATINLHCESLKTSHAVSKIEQMQELIKDTIKEVRAISHNLESALDSTGLRSTLEHMQQAIISSGRFEFGLYYELGNYKPPLALSREIVKIIQELITNTIKHANASSITAQLSRPGGHLQIIYEDNGKGFDTSVSAQGIGMKNIDDRINNIHGNWNIDSRPGYGTTVVVEIPLSA